jgi:hypothetical protein
VRSIRDPGSDELYEYRKTGEGAFDLCASFGGAADDAADRYGSPRSEFWRHGAGRVCFPVEVTRPSN